jgi:hypothetical protein
MKRKNNALSHSELSPAIIVLIRAAKNAMYLKIIQAVFIFHSPKNKP